MSSDSYIPPIDESEKHACWAHYMAGYEKQEISDLLGVNVNTLAAWIKKDGWVQKREDLRAANRKKNPPEQSPLAKMLAPDKLAKNVERFKEVAGVIAVEDIEHWRDLKPEERLVVAPAIGTLNKMHRSNLDLEKEEAAGRSAINISFLNNPGAVVELVDEAPPVRELEDQ